MLCRLLTTLGLAALVCVVTARADVEGTPGKVKKDARPSSEIKGDPRVLIEDTATRQAQLKRAFESFRQRLAVMAGRLENGTDKDKEKAKGLRKALKLASELGTESKFDSLIRELTRTGADQSIDVLRQAVRDNAELREDLKKLIALLSKDDAQANKELMDKHARLLEQLKELIAKQERVRAQTDMGRKNTKELEKDQNKVTRETRNLVDKKGDREPKSGEDSKGVFKPDGKPGIDGRGEARNDTQIKAEGKPAESKDGDSKEGKPGDSKEGKEGTPGQSKDGDSKEGKSGEGKSGDSKEGKPGDSKEGKSGEGKSGEGKPSDGKGGEGKSGEGKEGKGGDSKEGKSGEGKPSDGKGGEGKPSAQSGEGKSGEGKPGEGKSGEGKPGEGKPGEGKSGEGKQGQPGEGKPGEGKSGEGKPGEGKPGEGKAGEGKSGQGKSGEGKPSGKSGEGKPSGSKGQGEGKGESKPGKPSEGKAGSAGQPGESKSGGQSSSGKPGSGKSGQSGGGSQGGGDDQPQEDNPVKKQIEDANKYQKQAEIELDKKKREDASDNMTKAIKELEAAKKKLEDLLKQMREEEIERLLADLEKRCRYMLALQIEVRDGTVTLDTEIQKNVDKKPTLLQSARSNKLSDKEDEIVREAHAALKLIKTEGSAVAFAEVFEQVSKDMEDVRNRLARVTTDAVTQQIENDIIETLKEMIAALQKAQKEMKQQQGKPSQGKGMPQDQKLIDQIAELKMIYAMQKRVNARTELYGKQYKGEQAPLPEVAKTPREREHFEMIERELKDLAVRQQKIGKVTRDIATGKNEAK